jgi:hypothetical protein
MIILSETTDTLRLVLDAAVTTTELSCVTSWRDRSSTTFSAGRTAIATNGTTSVVITPAPTSSHQKIVDFISVFNGDTESAVVTVYMDDNGTPFTLWRDVLYPGDVLQYIEGAGFVIQRYYQAVKTFTVHGDAGVNWTLSNATLAERLAGGASRTIFMVDLLGFKQVRFRTNQQVTSASINTPVLRVKYFTEYTTTAAAFLQLGATQEVEISLNGVAYRDTGWIDMANGARINGCCIGFLESGGDGVADPALGATDILFR